MIDPQVLLVAHVHQADVDPELVGMNHRAQINFAVYGGQNVRFRQSSTISA